MSKKNIFQTLYVCGKIGAQLHPLESLVGYGLILPFLLTQNSNISSFFFQNFKIQTLIFVPLAFIPTWWTKHMLYVDIAWPMGVMMIGIQVILFSMSLTTTNLLLLRYVFLVGLALTVHGARMGFGALVMFYPYARSEDIPRYQYAKIRFLDETNHDNDSCGWWRFKRNHDIFQQCYVNMVILASIGALPIATAANNETCTYKECSPTQVSMLSWMGLMIWLMAWIFENVADFQKIRFMKNVKQKRMRNPTDKKYYVLGHPPYHDSRYFLWTWCRHPNYFCEWLAWCGLVISVIPCLYSLSQDETLFPICLWTLHLVFIPRLFYDCLMYWTGAAPAEHFSYKKRGELYAKYQKTTRVLFPFPLPYANHAQTPGWSVL